MNWNNNSLKLEIWNFEKYFLKFLNKIWNNINNENPINNKYIKIICRWQK